MLGINKITVSDKIDSSGNNTYVVKVDYYFQTGKDEFGLPALDLSKNTRLYANFEASYGRITRQKLTFPTFLGTELNPDIKKISTGYRYPFITKFNIPAEDDLDFIFEFQLFGDTKKGTKPYDRETRIQLFSGGNLKITNDDNIPIEDQRTNFYDNIFNIKIFASESSNNNSYLSELYASYSKKNSIRGIFIFDKQKFLMDNSVFGYLLDNSKIPKSQKDLMINNSDIVHMEITRRKVSNLRDFQNNPYGAYKDQVPQRIAIATQSKGILGATRGTISQLSSLNFDGMKYENVIAFNDVNLLDAGAHQYTLNMRVQDGVLKWLVTTVDTLIKNKDSISVDFLKDVVFTLNSSLNITQKDLKAYLENMKKHEGSLSILESYITDLVATLSSVIGNAGLISQVNTSYSKIYSANNLDRFFLTLEKRFDEVVNFEQAANLTYDYMGFAPNNDVGATTIRKEALELRFEREYDKLLKEKPESNYANLSRLIFADVFGYSDASDDPLRLAYFNFGPNYYAFLSPVRVGDRNLLPSNTFNYDLMTDEHLKKSYNMQLSPSLSVSYYLQEQGVSLGTQFFNEDPPLRDSSAGQTYFPANDIFSDSDGLANDPPVSSTSFKSGIDASPLTPASRLFASTFLRNKENWNLSKEDFDLTNETNLISSIKLGQLKIVRQIPNQIRAIFASKSDRCINQWLSPSMQGDYIYSPSTYYTIKQNYMNLLKIEFLSGFQKDANGLLDVKNPIFKKLRSLGGTGKILCRASIYNDERFKIGVAFDEISYADKYFILDLSELE